MPLFDKDKQVIKNNIDVNKELLNQCEKGIEIDKLRKIAIKKNLSLESKIWKLKVKHYELALAQENS